MVRPKHDDLRLAIIDLIEKNGGTLINNDGLVTQEIALALDADVKTVGDQLFKLRRRGIIAMDRGHGKTYTAILYDDWQSRMREEELLKLEAPAFESSIIDAEELDLVDEEVVMPEAEEPEEELEEEDDIAVLGRAMILEAARAITRCDEAEKILDRFTLIAEDNRMLETQVAALTLQLENAQNQIERMAEEGSGEDKLHMEIQKLKNALIIERNTIEELERKLRKKGPRGSGYSIGERLDPDQKRELIKLMQELPRQR